MVSTEGFKPKDVRRLLAGEQRDLVGLLRTLSDPDWESPSLCAGWRVRDVVGHLVGATTPLSRYLAKAARHRSVDKLNAHLVAEASSVPVSSLIDLLERSIGQGWTTTFLPSVILADTLVHHQDLRRPLGRPRVISDDRLLAVLDRPDPFTRPGGRMRALRLVATDVPWTAGSGPEVRGAGEAIALAIAGRGAVLDELRGEGVPLLRARLGAGQDADRSSAPARTLPKSR